MINSAKELVDSIRGGKSSATEAVQHSLDRICRYNASVNALVSIDKQSALLAAKMADKLLHSGQQIPPLLGVPITVKDAFETKGMSTTSSFGPLKDYIPIKDATIVARLREAGAIILGKTNLPELAADFQCWSPLFGRTNNPWNPALTSGGSSGGSAVAVAMKFSYLDVGSDLAGSIRLPAAFCGVAGHKATENRIPRTGHIPHIPGNERSVRHLLSFGLLARHVEDLCLGFSIISGPDGVDTEVPPVPIIDKSIKRERPLRVAWWDDFASLPLCRRTQSGLTNTVQNLLDAGIEVERAFPNGFDIEAAWYAFGIIMGTEAGMDMPLSQRTPFSLLGLFAPKSMPLLKAFSKGLSFNWRRYNQALNIREQMITHLESFLDNWDVLICPVTPSATVPHRPMRKYAKPPAIMVEDQALPYLEGNISMTAPFSLTGNPVTVIPVGIFDGHPVGIQVIGKRWYDEDLLRASMAIEKYTGGFQAPPDYV